MVLKLLRHFLVLPALFRLAKDLLLRLLQLLQPPRQLQVLGQAHHAHHRQLVLDRQQQRRQSV